MQAQHFGESLHRQKRLDPFEKYMGGEKPKPKTNVPASSGEINKFMNAMMGG